MHLHYQTLALIIAWSATLVALPLLLAVARRSAHARGIAEGQHIQQARHDNQVQWFEVEIASKQAELLDIQGRFDASMEARRKTIADLEERIMSYTGLAVTQADYQALANASETLKLAVRTWSQLKGADAWVERAKLQAGQLHRLALRVRGDLKSARVDAAEEGQVA